jgi:hypothetical protein
MRKSKYFLIFLALNIFLLGLMFLHSFWRTKKDAPVIAEKACLLERLQLTDLCLFTEASYTRHLSQSDLHTPFQDFPLSLEHFPSGSMAVHPPVMRRINAKPD